MSQPDRRAHVQALVRQFPRLLRVDAQAADIWFPPGWLELMRQLCSQLDASLDDAQVARFEVTQVKEKFGTLRFYFAVDGRGSLNVDVLSAQGHQRFETVPRLSADFPLQRVNELIKAAEAQSAVTCAICGAAGVLRRQVYLYVACDRCQGK